MAKVIKAANPTDIWVGDLKCGQVAEITQCPSVLGYVGAVVVRVGPNLVELGESAEESWGERFPPDGKAVFSPTFLVRVLLPGTQIEL